jgi:ABC-2 type transport system permease protein
MSTVLTHSGQMTLRSLRALARQPWYVAVTLVQPVIWLLLFGALFDRVTSIPGFTSDDYIEFLTPGVVILTALFSAGWSGMGIITDIDRGVMDRFLVSPVRRSALIIGRSAYQALLTVVQSLIILGLGWVAGARWDNPAGTLLVLGAAVLLAASFAALSDALALVLRREESVIAAVQFVVLPLSFASATFMQLDLAPGWIQAVARFNPVDWAVQSGRMALTAGADWGAIWPRAGALVVLTVACAAVATRAFNAYTRSI